MQFDDDKVDLGDLEDRRGSGGGGGGLGGFPGLGAGGSSGGGAGGLGGAVVAGGLAKMLGGGGIAAVVVIGLLLVLGGMGGDPTGGGAGGALTGQSVSGSGTGTGSASDMATRCTTADAIMKYDDCYVLKSMNEINEVWAGAFAQQGRTYTKPKLVYFNQGSVRTGGCGTASSQTGPFYCPGDAKIYVDLGFMNQLFQQIGASGRYAQTYVIAHEAGHHLQNILGIEKQVRRQQQLNPRQQNALSVRMELQADCFAGVYGRLANDAGNQKITAAEFQQALEAAAAVGDDRIMAGAGQRVNPESFTHGSAQQRQYWFQQGFNNPTLATCDTFAAGAP